MARRILILDNSGSMRRIIRTMILANINDAEVREAHDYQQAIEIVGKQAVNLVLFSRESSKPDWLNFISRSREEGAVVQFVLFTSRRHGNNLEDLKNAGVSEQLFIPCKPEELADVVTRLCSPRVLRAARRYYIPGAVAVLEQGVNKLESSIINFSKGGLLCETDFVQWYNWTAPVMITLNFPLNGEDVLAGGLLSATARLNVVESNSDFTPKRLRLAFRFVTVPEETGSILDTVFSYAEKLQVMQANNDGQD